MIDGRLTLSGDAVVGPARLAGQCALEQRFPGVVHFAKCAALRAALQAKYVWRSRCPGAPARRQIGTSARRHVVNDCHDDVQPGMPLAADPSERQSHALCPG